MGKYDMNMVQDTHEIEFHAVEHGPRQVDQGQQTSEVGGHQNKGCA